MKKPSKAKILDVISRSSGIVMSVAQSFGITRQVAYRWIHSDPEFEEAMQAARDAVVDVVESKFLTKAIKEDNLRCQEFLLKTLGKNRGYCEQIDIRNQDGTKLKIELIDNGSPRENFEEALFIPE